MNSEVSEINICEVCGNKDLDSVLDLGLHPMCDDLVPIGDSQVCDEYPIEILFCNRCLTAHQRYQVPKKELFPASYHYRSRFTADVLNGMKGLVDACRQKFGSLSGKKVLDIGCNDGSLLDCFSKQGAITIGIEPTDACLDADKKGHITYSSYLSEEVAESIVESHGKPDFITFTNVFAHIENLCEVICSLKKLISPATVIIIENHYLGSVLDGSQFDTFYHEHPRTYSYTSFVYMAKSLEVKLLDVEFPSRYGGNIRVFLGNAKIDPNKNTIELDRLRDRENSFFDNFDTLRKNIEIWTERKKYFLDKLIQKHGKLRAKAFPGRSAILVKLLCLDEDKVSAVYEKPGSLKIGHFLPGTRIPIYSDNDLFSQKNKNIPLLNLAWHIPVEIKNYLNEFGYTGEVFDILSIDDFGAP